MKQMGLVLALAIFGLLAYVATARAECPGDAMSSATGTAQQVLSKQITAASVADGFAKLAADCPDNKVVNYLYGVVSLNLHDELTDPQQKYAAVKQAFAALQKGDGWYNQQVLVNGAVRSLKHENRFRRTAIGALFYYTASGFPPPAYLTANDPMPECPKSKIVDAGEADYWIRYNKTHTDPVKSTALVLLTRLANACAGEKTWLDRTPLAYLAKTQVFLGERALKAGDRAKAYEYAQHAKANVATYLGGEKHANSWMGSDQTELDKLLEDAAPTLPKADRQAQFKHWCDPANTDTASKRLQMRITILQAWKTKELTGKKRLDGLMAVKEVITGMYGACAVTGRQKDNAALMYGVITAYNRAQEDKADSGYRRDPKAPQAASQVPDPIPSYLYTWMKPKPGDK